MTERPILFSGAMVRAIVEGRKTQTRRVMKQPPPPFVQRTPDVNPIRHPAPYFDAYCGERKTEANPRGMSDRWCWWTRDDRQGQGWVKCPYGQPGDRLWVRESFSSSRPWEPSWFQETGERPELWYWADGNPEYGDWTKPKPSIHMPRCASRLTLEITGIRVERLQAIDDCGAQAEGVTARAIFATQVPSRAGPMMSLPSYRAGFACLWDSLNAKRGHGWSVNPWVWVIEFQARECAA